MDKSPLAQLGIQTISVQLRILAAITALEETCFLETTNEEPDNALTNVVALLAYRVEEGCEEESW